MKAWIASAAALVLLAFVAPARADNMDALVMLDAPVDFTADYSLTANDQTWRGKVDHAPGRERRAFTTALGSQEILLRRDIDQAAVIWPQRKWYLTTSLRAIEGMVGGQGGLKVERRRDGTETLGNEKCERWLVEGDFAGRLWFTSDGILMRAAGILRLRGRETTLATQLAHIHRAAVDPDEFELPLGYRGIPVSPSLFGKID